MLEHAVHATATFSELGLAISLGLMIKIIKPAVDPDLIQRQTKEKRDQEKRKAEKRGETFRQIEETDGRGVALLHRGACALKDLVASSRDLAIAVISTVWSQFHYVTAALAFAALVGVAYCPASGSWSLPLALASFLLSAFKSHSVRHTLEPTHRGDLGIGVDPV